MNDQQIALLRRMAVQAQRSGMDMGISANIMTALLDEIEPRYFLFAWEDYEMSGGAGDFVGRYTTVEDAKTAERPHADRAQIAILEGQKFTVVLEWRSFVTSVDGKPREITGWFNP